MHRLHPRFARGDVENAEKMCLEIIRQDPTVPEPFQTLATLYEEAEEIEKSLQYALIAAHLGTTTFY
jgi:general transcription factor 3C polypeptide 3 (transcription factor C subunit 4)